MREKDKDPKFKHLKSKLDVIHEKVDQSKPSYKPFEKKKENKTDKTARKSEAQPEKPEEQLRLSRGFAEKNKKRLEANKLTVQKD